MFRTHQPSGSKLALIKHRHVHTVANKQTNRKTSAMTKITFCRCFSFQHHQNNPVHMLFQEPLSPAVYLLHFLLFTCMPKRSSDGQKAWRLSESRQKKVGTSVLLNQTKCPKLSRCTPLDRVMFHVCALPKIWWSGWSVGRMSAG